VHGRERGRTAREGERNEKEEGAVSWRCWHLQEVLLGVQASRRWRGIGQGTPRSCFTVLEVEDKDGFAKKSSDLQFF
jgi:hypothetical protein